jgi:hypothetical protein
MDQQWFEMLEIRKRRLNDVVWIPLRAAQRDTTGKMGFAGYWEEFSGVGSVGIPLDKKDAAAGLGWRDIGLGYAHRPSVEDGRYTPADVFIDFARDEDLSGVPLVLSQDGNRNELPQWHLHQDLVIALRLKRENDVWLAIDEGYIEVARLRRREGSPCLLEIRAEHLKDYLCARGLALLIASFHSRTEVREDAADIQWLEGSAQAEGGGARWEGSKREIHEGGDPFGSHAFVMHVGREGISSEDVPRIGPDDESITSESWTIARHGRKLIDVQGNLWKTEWVEPSAQSPRVREDELPPVVFFLTDNSGTRESAETLKSGGRWLWFRPEVIVALAHRRGGALECGSREIGHVRCSPSYDVTFGVNCLGLINVYAKDIARLPEWQQRLWAGFNISPEGGVSDELFEAQAKGVPAKTQAPERYLRQGIEILNRITLESLGFPLFRGHGQFDDILARTHRFRSTDQAGLFSLAKDLARLTADSIDTAGLQKLVRPPKGESQRSLKTLTSLLAQKISDSEARQLVAPLVGIYELRLADAHLPASDLAESLQLANVDPASPFVVQGYQLLHGCVSSLYSMARVLKPGSTSPPSDSGCSV